jgi:hypothetical protein
MGATVTPRIDFKAVHNRNSKGLFTVRSANVRSPGPCLRVPPAR